MDTNNALPSEIVSVNDNEWSDEHETVLRHLHKTTTIYSKRFHHAYTRYKQKLQYYRIPIIIMQAISGFASVLNIGYVPQQYSKWVSLSVGFVNLMATVISLIETFKKIDQIMNKSYASYFAFKTLSDELFIILRTPRQDRKYGGVITVNKYFIKYQTAYSNIPLLDSDDTIHLQIPTNVDGFTEDDAVTEIQQLKKQINKINFERYDDKLIEMTEMGIDLSKRKRSSSSSSTIMNESSDPSKGCFTYPSSGCLTDTSKSIKNKMVSETTSHEKTVSNEKLLNSIKKETELDNHSEQLMGIFICDPTTPDNVSKEYVV